MLYWTGFYSSRPSFKKHIKDASAQFYAQSKLYALDIIDKNINDALVEEILHSNYEMLDALSIMQHHDAIAGTAA